MSKRKSIGADPLDWIGEPNAVPRDSGGASGEKPAASHSAAPDVRSLPSQPREQLELESAESFPPGAMVSVDTAPSAFQLERQLLLVDEILRPKGSRPSLNQVLWSVLFLMTFLGLGILFFQENRRQWNARFVSLEGTIERIEKEKGRNERLFEQVLGEKDNLIREKQGTIGKMETLHQTTAEELRNARREARRLQEENKGLLQQFLNVGQLLGPMSERPKEKSAGEALKKAPEIDRAAAEQTETGPAAPDDDLDD